MNGSGSAKAIEAVTNHASLGGGGGGAGRTNNPEVSDLLRRNSASRRGSRPSMRRQISLGTLPPACRPERRDISWKIAKPPNYSPT